MGCDLRGDGSLGWGGDGCLGHCLNCDLGGFGGWAVIWQGWEFGVGRGRVSGLALSEL